MHRPSLCPYTVYTHNRGRETHDGGRYTVYTNDEGRYTMYTHDLGEAYTTGGCLWKGVSLILENKRLEHSTVMIPEPSESSRAGKKISSQCNSEHSGVFCKATVESSVYLGANSVQETIVNYRSCSALDIYAVMAAIFFSIFQDTTSLSSTSVRSFYSTVQC